MKDLLRSGQILGRDELKKIMAGSGGNIYCNIGGGQWGCGLGDLIACTDSCVQFSGALHTTCGGCAQFPPL